MKELEKRIRKLLLEVGVDPSSLGYKYLVEGIRLVCEDNSYLDNITIKLYPTIAWAFDAKAYRCERAMRYAIAGAVMNNPNIQKTLLMAPKQNSGTYTVSQFIALCAEFLKMEGEK